MNTIILYFFSLFSIFSYMQYIQIEKWKKETDQWTELDARKRFLWALFLGACHEKIYSKENDFALFLEKIVSVRAPSMLFTLEHSFLFVSWFFVHLSWCGFLLKHSYIDSTHYLKLPAYLFVFGTCYNKSSIPIMYIHTYFLFWSVPLLLCYQSFSPQFWNEIPSRNGILDARTWVVCFPTGW